jgi:hypothetical protein
MLVIVLAIIVVVILLTYPMFVVSGRLSEKEEKEK